MIIPALIGAFATPLYLFTDFYATVAGAFIVPCFPRSNLRAEPVLSVRTASDRGAGDRIGLLLPPGAIWAGFTGPVPDLLCRQSAVRLHRSDADRHEWRRRRVRRHPAFQPGDERQGVRSAAHLGVVAE
jgi:hypothetical protein